ncbi:MAG: hypothetical protein RSC43_00900 [Clostridia bacterium]
MKRLVSVILPLVILLSLTACSVSDETIERYAKVFCQTTSDKLWQQNKDFLLKHSTEDMQEELTNWFEGTNYFDSLSVKLRDITTTTEGKETKSLALLECSNDSTNYFVILNLTFTGDKMSDFEYQSVSNMYRII